MNNRMEWKSLRFFFQMENFSISAIFCRTHERANERALKLYEIVYVLILCLGLGPRRDQEDAQLFIRDAPVIQFVLKIYINRKRNEEIVPNKNVHKTHF